MKKQENKGITLISLIVTIIVLIIIAGVSMSLISGGDGIIAKTSLAVEEHNKSVISEDIQLKMSELTSNILMMYHRAPNMEDVYNEFSAEDSGYVLIIASSIASKADVFVNPSDWNDVKFLIIIPEDNVNFAVRFETDENGNIQYSVNKNADGSDYYRPTATITNLTTNSVTFSASDEGTGVEAYLLQENDEEPLASSNKWITFDGSSTTVNNLEQGQTYYLFIKDKAGNVSKGLSTEIESVTSLVKGDVNFTYTPESWTNGSVTVKAKLKEGLSTNYTLKITDINPVGASKETALAWANASEGIVVDSNKEVYAILIDNEGQIGSAASANVGTIDKTLPEVRISSTGTNSITFSVSDTAGTSENASGVCAYMITTSGIKPSAIDSGWVAFTGTSTTVSGKTQGTTYYVYVKDNAGNISDGASQATGSVAASNGNISVSSPVWNGSVATVTMTTNLGYYIQTKVGNGNWSENQNSGCTVNAESCSTIYARLTDSTGQNAGDCISINVTKQVNVTFDNNYLNNNVFSDYTNLDNYYDCVTAMSAKVNYRDSILGNRIVSKLTLNSGTGNGPFFGGTYLTIGQQYTWSVYLKASTPKTLVLGQEQAGLITERISTEWKRYTYTYTANDCVYCAFIFYLNGDVWNAGDELYVSDLQLCQGSSLNISSTVKNCNAQLGSLSNPTRSGYSFAGWYTDPVGGNRVYDTTIVPANNITYYAHWTANN